MCIFLNEVFARGRLAFRKSRIALCYVFCVLCGFVTGNIEDNEGEFQWHCLSLVTSVAVRVNLFMFCVGADDLTSAKLNLSCFWRVEGLKVAN